jgi:FkbM family methyltransferase
MYPSTAERPSPADAIVAKLRPRKVRSALRRRWFEWRMPRLPLDPMPGLQALGTEYGSYVVPSERIGADWVCYCVGTGADVSFELGLIETRGVEVRSFEAVLNLADYVREQTHGEPRLSIEHAALALEDGPVRMQVSHVPVSQSVSAAGLYDGSNYVEVPGRTLASMMEEHDDDRIDLLKVDVEGLEYELLPTLDLRALGVQVLCTQFHHTASVGEAKALIARLRDEGYELVACHPTVKLTFVARALLLGD